MFDKIDSIKVSEIVFTIAKGLLEDKKLDIDGWLETFNNCREQGYMMIVSDSYNTKKENYMKELYIWVAENRNSDDIVVYYDRTRKTSNNDITQYAYDNARYFAYNEFYEAAKYIIELVEEHHNKYLEEVASEKNSFKQGGKK